MTSFCVAFSMVREYVPGAASQEPSSVTAHSAANTFHYDCYDFMRGKFTNM